MGIDSAGVNHTLLTDVSGAQIHVTLEQAIAMGRYPNGTAVVAIGKFVSNPTVFTALLNTAYNEPTGSIQRSVSSTSVNDTLAGTGARTVKITYYDNLMNGPFFETIALSGTTANNTVNAMRFIEKMEVMTAGTVGGLSGTLTLFNGTNGAGGTLAQMGGSSGGQIDNTTLWAHHYVAVGRTAYIEWWNTRTDQGVAAPVADVVVQRLMSRDPTVANSPLKQLTTENTATSIGGLVFDVTYPVPIKVVGPARIVAYGLSRGGISTNVSTSFGLIEL